jgi:hypothetical protein
MTEPMMSPQKAGSRNLSQAHNRAISAMEQFVHLLIRR